MAPRVLQIIEAAHPTTHGHESHPIAWIDESIRRRGTDLHLLLRGEGVRHASDPGDLRVLLGHGVDVFLVAEDAAERGVDTQSLPGGIRAVLRAELAELFAAFDQIWHW